jgi:hypothetical protein
VGGADGGGVGSEGALWQVIRKGYYGGVSQEGGL